MATPLYSFRTTYLDSLTPTEIRDLLEAERSKRVLRPIARQYLIERLLREKLYTQIGYSRIEDATEAFGLRPADLTKSSRAVYQRLLTVGFSPQEVLNFEPLFRGPTRMLKHLIIKLHETSDKVEIETWLRSKQQPEDRDELLATSLLMKRGKNNQDLTNTAWSSLAQEWHTEQRTVANTFQVLRTKYGIIKDGHALSLLAALYVVIRDYPYGRRRGKLTALAEEYSIDASVIDRDLFSTEIPARNETIAITIEAEETSPLSIRCSPAEMRFLRHCFRRLAQSQGRFIGVTTTYHDLLLSIFVDWQDRLDAEE